MLHNSIVKIGVTEFVARALILPSLLNGGRIRFLRLLILHFTKDEQYIRKTPLTG